MTDILTGTPPDLTYGHEMVRQAWTVVWVIASGALAVIIGWMGLSLIMSEHLGRQQVGWREKVPRLGLGLVAAASSLWWCALVLDVADAVSGFVAAVDERQRPETFSGHHSTHSSPAVQAGSVGMAQLLALLYLVYGFFVLYVLVQMVSAPGSHRHPDLALAPNRPGTVDPAAHGGMGSTLAAAVHGDGVPAGDPAHRARASAFGFLERVRLDIAAFEAGAGPGLEAADVPCLRLHGDQSAVDAWHRRGRSTRG